MRFLILTVLLVSFLFAFAPYDNPLPNIYQENNPVRVETRSLTTQVWQDFFQRHDRNWIVMIDPVSGAPRRVMGKSIMPDGFDYIDENNVEEASLAFIDQNLAFLHAEGSEFVLESKHNKIGRWFVHFDQYHEGIMVYNSRVSLTIRPETGVYSFGSSCKRDIDIDTEPAFDIDFAKGVIIGDMGNLFQDGEFHEHGLVVFSRIVGKEYRFHLAYWIDVKAGGFVPGAWEYLIDAHTGEVLQRLSLLRTFGGTVTGHVKPRYHSDANIEMPFPHKRVFIDGAIYHTDEYGYWSVPGPVSMHTFQTSLYGHWCNVNNEDYPDANFATTFSSDPFLFTWTTAHAHIDETTVYYHVNFLHDWIVEKFDEDCMDYRIPANVKVGDNYDNAYYSGFDRSINFGEGGSYFYNLALHCDVIYHEYTHGITHHIYPAGSLPYTGQSGALDEALADYFPASILDETRMGIRLYRSSPSMYMRNCDNENRYPEDYTGSVHHDGMIASGAMWDIRGEIGNRRADSLAHFARYEYPATYEAYLYAMLSVDDEDGDITNGTPNAVAIYDSWFAHGIGPGTSLAMHHSSLPDSEDSENPYFAEFEVVSTVTIDTDASFLSWSNDMGITWTETPLIEGVSIWEFSAAIPAQPIGTAVYYYITVENIGGQVVVEPEEGALAPHSFTVDYDTEPPVIAHSEMPVQSLIVWPAIILCDVTDNLGLETVECQIEIAGVARPSVELTRVGDTDRYRGYIDTHVRVGDIVNYRIYAQDASIAGNETYYPAEGWYSFEVVDYYFEPFEYEYNPYTTYYATEGFGNQWHRQSHLNYTAGGSISYKCGSRIPGEDYADRLDAVLESPRLNLGENTVLTFYHYMRSEISGYFTGYAYDGGIVEVKPEGGEWAQVTPVGGYPYIIRNVSETGPFDTGVRCFAGEHDWQLATFDLSDYTGPVFVRWRFGSDRAFEDDGWYIDDIRVETEFLLVANDNAQTPHQIGFNIYPNPFNSSSAIEYPAGTKAITIYDVSGRVVEEASLAAQQAGTYRFTPHSQESGVYTVIVETAENSFAKKAVLIK